MKQRAAMLLVCILLAGVFGAFGEDASAPAPNTAQESRTEEQRELTYAEELEKYQDNRAIIYIFLREELGLNRAAACGILANIHVESRFNPEALGDNGTSYGICQWHNRRYTNLINWSNMNGLDYTQLDTQLLFMKHELEHRFNYIYDRLLNRTPDTSRGAYSAGKYWCVYYELPKNKYVAGDQRGEMARQRYWLIFTE